jgi:hypothetical protein
MGILRWGMRRGKRKIGRENVDLTKVLMMRFEHKDIWYRRAEVAGQLVASANEPTIYISDLVTGHTVNTVKVQERDVCDVSAVPGSSALLATGLCQLHNTPKELEGQVILRQRVLELASIRFKLMYLPLPPRRRGTRPLNRSSSLCASESLLRVGWSSL